MQKFEQIEQELRYREDVIITHKIEKFNEELFPQKYGIPLETHFFVTPSSGLYEAEELQKFMLNLLPNTPPKKMEKFSEGESFSKRVLYLGALFFQEEIGTFKITEECKITGKILERILKAEGKNDEDIKDTLERRQVKSNEHPIYQETTLYVFPNTEIAEILKKSFRYGYKHELGENWRYISKKTLNHFNPKKGLLKKLLSK
ncbi:MAG: hypothetical protein KKF52_01025 [Nanoarchaeota archaeon]|nr:hypothetical protein [Nanoarchaeota archaeon]MBU4241791.1 hypothetical protein [Nanoarchaeota archaeon]MBU4352059.1 hypothetical protein [Nanoarchaeota archaeon]